MTRDAILDQDFIERLVCEMHANAGKGDWRAWVDDEDTDWESVLEELDDHVAKLKRAIKQGYGLGKIQEHAADIAGNAMFAHRFALRQHEWFERYLNDEDE